MAQLKTKQNEQSVEDFLNESTDEKKRQDSFIVLELMKKATGREPKMWGANIVGFGCYNYQYESGREGKWFLVGFAPRKANLTLYIMSGFSKYAELLAKLGKHKTGNSCLHINKTEDVNLDVLREMIEKSVDAVTSGKIKL
ncbi:MAG: DUF1801 domain-containing protein [Acidobacteria bacterium]|nr:DUF1801 domain-containing protein [Acidobacteriota bacterium]MCA1637695.1 DUF1801 domain-containing protein [Acidobacteriota bacterium]